MKIRPFGAISRYVKAVKELTGKDIYDYGYCYEESKLAIELTMWIRGGKGIPLKVLLPDNEEEIEWKTQRLNVLAKNAVGQPGLIRVVPVMTTTLDANLHVINRTVTVPESWVELDTMRALV